MSSFLISLRIFLIVFVVHHCPTLMLFSLVRIQVTFLFGFIRAITNTAMVPNYANIVDMHLV